MNYAVAKELEENPFGVTEVFTAPDAVVDVVLVHGLTGHPYNTWSTDDRKVFWPVDLLPTNVKKARILVYGYDADVASFKGGTSKDKIHNHAETLVQRLSANRSLEDATERPIIFICHSLGGLVVKRALSYSCNVTNANLEQQRSIYVSTYGVLFLGTPHNGSDLAKWGSLLQAIASVAPKKVLDSSPQLVDALKSQSETLQNINRYFVQIMYRFHILFCHEGKPTDLKGTRQFVVDEDSAAPPFADVERMVIETDHSHMCKFATKRSPGYEGVAEAIKRFAENAPGTIKRRWSEERDARRDALRAQAFDMIPKSVMDSIGGSPHTGTASTAGRSQQALPAPEESSRFGDVYEVEEMGDKDVEMA
ncbi:MAG: hypothetical protein M1830_010171 [Pleopsidium flavum]|nr:MAG: hypothetical protein M1830_010171 [Pleopsidium flavum]